MKLYRRAPRLSIGQKGARTYILTNARRGLMMFLSRGVHRKERFSMIEFDRRQFEEYARAVFTTDSPSGCTADAIALIKSYV